MQGIVHRIRADLGFAFIRVPGDERRADHLFHKSELSGALFDERLVGKQCEFESERVERGLNAQNVRISA
jgi:cold shock CspA family protein